MEERGGALDAPICGALTPGGLAPPAGGVVLLIGGRLYG
jgi:hypothetical protein